MLDAAVRTGAGKCLQCQRVGAIADGVDRTVQTRLGRAQQEL